MAKRARVRSASPQSKPGGVRLGYACMNVELGLGTSRTVRLASLGDVEKVRGVVESNLAVAEAIVRWNGERRIGRLGSQFVPFASHPAFPYDWEREHRAALARLGKTAKGAGVRLSMHPGQYVCPGSERAEVVEKSLAELRYAARVLELAGAEDGVVVIHLGGAYGNRPAAMRRFVAALRGERGLLRYLALENDKMVWTPEEAIHAASELGVGAIVDNLHWRLNPGRMGLAEAVAAARALWGDRRPKLHLSSQDPEKQRGAHAGFIDCRDYEELAEACGGQGDVMVEAKGKEQAVLALRGRRIGG